MQTLKFSPTSCLFSLFPSCCHFWRDFQKFFLPFFHHSLPREGVTSIGPISLDSLKEFDKKFRVSNNKPYPLPYSRQPTFTACKKAQQTTKNLETR